MKDLFSTEALRAVEDLFVSENEKEINQITTVQGQLAALVAMLSSKGIFDGEDVHTWETKSEEMGKQIKEILVLGAELAEMGTYYIDDEEEDEYTAKRISLAEKTVAFCKDLGKSAVSAQSMLDDLRELDSGTDQED